MANKGHFRRYLDIPLAPTLSSPVTIIPSDIHVPSQSFLNTLHGMTAHVAHDIITSGNFSAGFTLRDFTPPGPTYYRFVSTAGDIFGAPGGVPHAITDVIDGDYQAFYGALSPPTCKGQNGFQLPSRSTGSNFIIQSYVIDSPTASGMTANFGVGGSNFYNSLDVSFLRSFNAGQEGICYIGHTSSPYDYIQTATVHDCFSYNSSREGTQTEHVNVLHLWNNTVILSGQTGGAGQDGLIQLHDVNGLVENSVYDGAPTPGTTFSHDTTVRNCYFRWTTNASLFIGDSAGSYFGGSPRLNGRPLLYDSCYFHYDGPGTLAALATVAEKGCDIEFRNCVFSTNITTLYSDIRGGGPTNLLIGTLTTNGNTQVAITAPSYVSGYNVTSDYLHHGLLDTSSLYYFKRMGYRTPRPGY